MNAISGRLVHDANLLNVFCKFVPSELHLDRVGAALQVSVDVCEKLFGLKVEVDPTAIGFCLGVGAASHSMQRFAFLFTSDIPELGVDHRYRE